jgi:hypothetical protein
MELVPDEMPATDGAMATEETPIEPSDGDEPPPVADVSEVAEASTSPVEVDEAASPNPIESTE